jgi:ech hydrogenase subunit A
MVNLGVYLLLRLWHPIGSVPELSWAVALVGAVSFLATSVLAIANSSSKRVLAYSTIGNLGLIVLCAAIGTREAVYAGMLLLLFHAISKALLFLAVGVVKHETGSEDIEPMLGLRERMPLVTFALMVGVVTILLPPFGAFASKWMISEIISEVPLLAIFLALGFGASVVFYGKWLGRAFALGPRQRPPMLTREGVAAPFRISLGALMAGAVAIPFLITPLTDYLLEPFLGPLPTDLLALGTAYGSVPLLALLVLASIATLFIAAFVRPRREEVSTAYTGGEPFEFDLAGSYFIDRKGESGLNLAFSFAAVLLLLLIVLIPLMQEASLWPQ